MALVFYVSEILACLPTIKRRDLSAYMHEAFRDPFKPRGAENHRKTALSFQSHCQQQEVCLLMSGHQASETFSFRLSLSLSKDHPDRPYFSGKMKHYIASAEGHILPFYEEDDVVPISTRAQPSGKVLAITRAEILTPDTTFYTAPAPTMVAASIFRAVHAISRSHDYQHLCPTDALNALLAIPLRDPIAPAQRVSCLAR